MKKSGLNAFVAIACNVLQLVCGGLALYCQKDGDTFLGMFVAVSGFNAMSIVFAVASFKEKKTFASLAKVPRYVAGLIGNVAGAIVFAQLRFNNPMVHVIQPADVATFAILAGGYYVAFRVFNRKKNISQVAFRDMFVDMEMYGYLNALTMVVVHGMFTYYIWSGENDGTTSNFLFLTVGSIVAAIVQNWVDIKLDGPDVEKEAMLRGELANLVTLFCPMAVFFFR